MTTLGLINLGTAPDDGNGEDFRSGGEVINDNTALLQAFIDAAGFTFISKESDFPTQDATTITLKSQVVHVITAAFTTTKNFLPENGAVWTSFNQNGPLVTYSGSGTMFSGTNVTFDIFGCSIDCPSATAFAFTDTVVNVRLFRFQDVTLVSCNKIGTFTGMLNALFLTGAAFNANDGITYAGTNLVAATINRMFFGSTSASFIGVDIGTATIQNPEFDNMIMQAPVSAIGISGAVASANVPAGFLGMVSNSSFSGGMTDISGIATDDFRWRFNNNTPTSDTIEDALLSLNGNATVTTISVINTPVLVAGTWTCQRESLLTCTTAGRATYDAERDIVLPIDVIATIDPVSDSDVTVYVALNGSIISDSGIKTFVKSTDPQAISTMWQLNLSNGDFLEVFVENNTGTANITVTDAIFRVR